MGLTGLKPPQPPPRAVPWGSICPRRLVPLPVGGQGWSSALRQRPLVPGSAARDAAPQVLARVMPATSAGRVRPHAGKFMPGLRSV